MAAFWPAVMIQVCDDAIQIAHSPPADVLDDLLATNDHQLVAEAPVT